MKKISKTKLNNYCKIADYLNVKCTEYKYIEALNGTVKDGVIKETVEKVNRKLKMQHLEFDEALKQAKLKLKEEQKKQKAIERKNQKEKEKQKRLQENAELFISEKKHGIATTKEYARPYCFDTYDLICGSYKRNTGAGLFDVNIILGDKFNAVTCQRNNWNIYSKACKFPCNDYETIITLPKKGYFQLIGGLWTWTENKNIKGCKCAWVEQKGLYCSAVYGFLINGYHIAKDDKIKNIKDAREYLLSIRLKQRANNLKLTKKFFTISDSLNAGNCKSGSLAFANAHNIDPDGTYSGSYLLSIATTKEMPFVKRFVK